MTDKNLKAEAEKIIEMRARGFTRKQIGEELFMCPGNVNAVVKKAGLYEEYMKFSRMKVYSDNKEEIRRLLESGAPYSEICGRFGVGKQTVIVWRNRLGIPPRPTGGGNSLHLDVNEIVRLRKEGRSYKEIGELLDASAGAIQHNLRKAGIKCGKTSVRKFPKDPVELEKVKRLLESDKTTQELSQQLGVGLTTVSVWRRKIGVMDTGRGRRRTW